MDRHYRWCNHEDITLSDDGLTVLTNPILNRMSLVYANSAIPHLCYSDKRSTRLEPFTSVIKICQRCHDPLTAYNTVDIEPLFIPNEINKPTLLCKYCISNCFENKRIMTQKCMNVNINAKSPRTPSELQNTYRVTIGKGIIPFKLKRNNTKEEDEYYYYSISEIGLEEKEFILEYECSILMEIGDRLIQVNDIRLNYIPNINEVLYNMERPITFTFQKKSRAEAFDSSQSVQSLSRSLSCPAAVPSRKSCESKLNLLQNLSKEWNNYPSFYFEISILKCDKDSNIICGFLPDPNQFSLEISDETILRDLGLLTFDETECVAGNTIGCGINPISQKLFYIIDNNEDNKIEIRDYKHYYTTEYYPVIYTSTNSIKFHTNFGDKPFVYNNKLRNIYLVNNQYPLNKISPLKLIKSLSNTICYLLDKYQRKMSLSNKEIRSEIRKYCEMLSNIESPLLDIDINKNLKAYKYYDKFNRTTKLSRRTSNNNIEKLTIDQIIEQLEDLKKKMVNMKNIENTSYKYDNMINNDSSIIPYKNRNHTLYIIFNELYDLVYVANKYIRDNITTALSKYNLSWVYPKLKKLNKDHLDEINELLDYSVIREEFIKQNIIGLILPKSDKIDPIYQEKIKISLLKTLKHCNQTHIRYLSSYLRELLNLIDYYVSNETNSDIIIDIIRSFSALCSFLPQPAANYSLLVKSYNILLNKYINNVIEIKTCEFEDKLLYRLSILTYFFCHKLFESFSSLEIDKMLVIIYKCLKSKKYEIERNGLLCIKSILNAKEIRYGNIIKKAKIKIDPIDCPIIYDDERSLRERNEVEENNGLSLNNSPLLVLPSPSSSLSISYNEIVSPRIPSTTSLISNELIRYKEELIKEFINYIGRCDKRQKSKLYIYLKHNNPIIDSIYVILCILNYMSFSNENNIEIIKCQYESLMELLKDNHLNYMKIKVHIYSLLSPLLIEYKDNHKYDEMYLKMIHRDLQSNWKLLLCLVLYSLCNFTKYNSNKMNNKNIMLKLCEMFKNEDSYLLYDVYIFLILSHYSSHREFRKLLSEKINLETIQLLLDESEEESLVKSIISFITNLIQENEEISLLSAENNTMLNNKYLFSVLYRRYDSKVISMFIYSIILNLDNYPNLCIPILKLCELFTLNFSYSMYTIGKLYPILHKNFHNFSKEEQIACVKFVHDHSISDDLRDGNGMLNEEICESLLRMNHKLIWNYILQYNSIYTQIKFLEYFETFLPYQNVIKRKDSENRLSPNVSSAVSPSICNFPSPKIENEKSGNDISSSICDIINEEGDDDDDDDDDEESCKEYYQSLTNSLIKCLIPSFIDDSLDDKVIYDQFYEFDDSYMKVVSGEVFINNDNTHQEGYPPKFIYDTNYLLFTSLLQFMYNTMFSGNFYPSKRLLKIYFPVNINYTVCGKNYTLTKFDSVFNDKRHFFCLYFNHVIMNKQSGRAIANWLHSHKRVVSLELRMQKDDSYFYGLYYSFLNIIPKSITSIVFYSLPSIDEIESVFSLNYKRRGSKLIEGIGIIESSLHLYLVDKENNNYFPLITKLFKNDSYGVKWYDLQKNDLTDEDVSEILSVLKDNSSVESFDFSNNNINVGDRMTEILCSTKEPNMVNSNDSVNRYRSVNNSFMNMGITPTPLIFSGTTPNSINNRRVSSGSGLFLSPSASPSTPSFYVNHVNTFQIEPQKSSVVNDINKQNNIELKHVASPINKKTVPPLVIPIMSRSYISCLNVLLLNDNNISISNVIKLFNAISVVDSTLERFYITRNHLRIEDSESKMDIMNKEGDRLPLFIRSLIELFKSNTSLVTFDISENEFDLTPYFTEITEALIESKDRSHLLHFVVDTYCNDWDTFVFNFKSGGSDVVNNKMSNSESENERKSPIEYLNANEGDDDRNPDMILFMSLPLESKYLRIEDEKDSIINTLNKSTCNIKLNIVYGNESRITPCYHPQIFHYAGHVGIKDSVFILEDCNGGEIKRNSKDFINYIYPENTYNLRLVYLNACYNETILNQLLEKKIPHIISCNKEYATRISDSVCIEFSHTFYQALFRGYTVYNAYKLACNSVSIYELENNKPPFILSPINGNHEEILFYPIVKHTFTIEEPIFLLPKLPKIFVGQGYRIKRLLKIYNSFSYDKNQIIIPRITLIHGKEGTGKSLFALGVLHYIETRELILTNHVTFYISLEGYKNVNEIMKFIKDQMLLQKKRLEEIKPILINDLENASKIMCLIHVESENNEELYNRLNKEYKKTKFIITTRDFTSFGNLSEKTATVDRNKVIIQHNSLCSSFHDDLIYEVYKSLVTDYDNDEISEFKKLYKNTLDFSNFKTLFNDIYRKIREFRF